MKLINMLFSHDEYKMYTLPNLEITFLSNQEVIAHEVLTQEVGWRAPSI